MGLVGDWEGRADWAVHSSLLFVDKSSIECMCEQLSTELGSFSLDEQVRTPCMAAISV